MVKMVTKTIFWSLILKIKIMENKKWATIISGQPRADIVSAKRDYDEFISGLNHNPDVFSHTMMSNDVISYWGIGGWSSINGKPPTQIRSNDEIINLWNPKKFLSENYYDFDFDNRVRSSGFSMTYGIKKSFELLQEFENETNTKYDYVIRWRYDLNVNSSTNFESRKKTHRFLKESDPLFAKLKEPYRSQPCDFWGNDFLPDLKFIEEVDSKIDWQYIVNEISDDKTIFVSPGWNWGSYGCCDLFLIGSRKSMEIYSKYHEKFGELSTFYSANEGVLRHYLEKTFNFRVLNYYFGDVGIYR